MSVVSAVTPAHLDAILSKLTGVKSEGDHWKALCPAHNDRNPSLGIALGRDHRVLLTCYAGCTIDAILDALGVAVTDLFADADRPVSSKPQIVTNTYIYQNEQREPAYRVLRLHPKSFQQQRPNGRGGWVFGLNGTEPVLYRLPELIESDPRQPVFKCAGEKDVDRLVSLGLIATTNSMGEGKTDSAWRPQYSHALRDRSVVILADNDAPGLAHAHFVASKLHGVARKVRVIVLPGLPDHGDVSDWLDAGHTKQELVAIIRDAPAWDPDAVPIVAVDTVAEKDKSKNKTDIGNAERLVAHNAGVMRYCHEWGSWMIWDNTRFRQDKSGEIYRRAKRCVRAMYDEAKNEEDDDARKKLVSHALKSESVARIKGMIEFARDEEGMAIATDEMDADHFLFNVANGTVDLRTGRLVPHDPGNLITRISPVHYDLDAQCPQWNSFLDRVMDRNDGLIDFLQRAIGYSMTGNTDEQAMFILHGNGQNGKSKLIDVINYVLADYAKPIPTERLMVRYGDAGIPNDLARLAGVRFTASTETTEGKRLDESMVKTMTGGDPIPVRFLHKETFDLIPRFKLWLATNHKPMIRGTDKGIWRRIRLIPFSVEIPEEERDLKIVDKLLTEASGILNWMILGCLNWQEHGLSAPEEVMNATSLYREEMDVFGTFLRDCCVIDRASSASSRNLYAAFKDWSSENGEYQMTNTAFGKKLSELGLERKVNFRGSTGVSYMGIRLKGVLDDNEQEDTKTLVEMTQKRVS